MTAFLKSFLAGLVISSSSVAWAGDHELTIKGECTILKFDRPADITNEGTKFTAAWIINDKTGRWEAVWGNVPWKESWIAEYLKFDGLSDDVHQGETLKILRPTTIAVVVFGDGSTIARSSVLPALKVESRSSPESGSKADPVFLFGKD